MPQMVGWKWIEIKHNNEREEPKEHNQRQQHNSNNKKARHNNKHVRGTSHPPGHHGTPLMKKKTAHYERSAALAGKREGSVCLPGVSISSRFVRAAFHIRRARGCDRGRMQQQAACFG